MSKIVNWDCWNDHMGLASHLSKEHSRTMGTLHMLRAYGQLTDLEVKDMYVHILQKKITAYRSGLE